MEGHTVTTEMLSAISIPNTGRQADVPLHRECQMSINEMLPWPEITEVG